jgi:hypothetical protein
MNPIFFRKYLDLLESFGSSDAFDPFPHETAKSAYELLMSRERDKLPKETIKELEREVAKDAEYSYQYALNWHEGPWPWGEAAISEDPKFSYWYANDVIKDRWEDGEAAIARDPESSYAYAVDTIGGRWRDGEAAIYSDPHLAKLYSDFLARTAKPSIGYHQERVIPDSGYWQKK